MPTITIHLAPEVISRLTTPDAGPIEVTISLTETTALIQEPPVVPAGPLAGLLTSGLLKAGTPLRLVQTRANRSANATVLANGSILVEGKTRAYSSPSKAASAVTGTPANGWVLWRVPDGRTLDDLRDQLEEGDQ
ncbi:DUF4357 domain-containing protein [Acrocarpospora catenulata]|uniref:DUF4357 domain-containing protein n=1 Tax=Acrocarpospora catenulata TaxID=2836182 RepID=UPI001BD9AD39|nr:DUF4357 domain-containing protein [Acrocarpospora catenulata]